MAQELRGSRTMAIALVEQHDALHHDCVLELHSSRAIYIVMAPRLRGSKIAWLESYIYGSSNGSRSTWL